MTEAEEIWAILRENARQLQETRQRLEETRQIADSNTRGLQETRQLVEENSRGLQRTQQLVESNARAIQANSDAIAASRTEGENLKASIADLVSMITSLAEDAARERVEFRETVRQILDALMSRFSSNGHGESDR